MSFHPPCHAAPLPNMNSFSPVYQVCDLQLLAGVAALIYLSRKVLAICPTIYMDALSRFNLPNLSRGTRHRNDGKPRQLSTMHAWRYAFGHSWARSHHLLTAALTRFVREIDLSNFVSENIVLVYPRHAQREKTMPPAYNFFFKQFCYHNEAYLTTSRIPTRQSYVLTILLSKPAFSHSLVVFGY